MQTSSIGRKEMIQEQAGVVGAGTTVGAGVLGWIAAAIPVLQALSLTVSVLVGIATLVWYVIKIKRGK
jgi:hypothetical protein